jgi:hypothetical protein
MAYEPDWEDWLFHVVMPLCAYALLAGSAVATSSYPREALFAVAAAILVLLFVGIHNAWDMVVYHVFVRLPEGSITSAIEASPRKQAEAEELK